MNAPPGARIETTTCYVDFAVEFELPQGVSLRADRSGFTGDEDDNSHSFNLTVRAGTPEEARQKLAEVKRALVEAIGEA